MIFKIYKLKILAKYEKLKQKVIKLSKKILQKYNNIYNQTPLLHSKYSMLLPFSSFKF